MNSLKSFWTYTFAVVAAVGTMGTASLCQADGAAAQPIGKVIAVKHSGYATRLQQSVKHTIKAGDILYEGDQLDVKSGNVVQVALDSDSKNIIHVQGETLVGFSKERGMSLDMTRGKVFAILDKLQPAGGQFRIVTPTAVTTVRGTYFQVKTSGSGTEAIVYRGEVAVNGRLDNGKSLGSAIPITAGQKTAVAHTGTTPSAPQLLSAAEFEEINDVIRSIDSSRKPLSYKNLNKKELGKNSKKSSGSSDDVTLDKSKKSNDDDAASSSGKVVF